MTPVQTARPLRPLAPTLRKESVTDELPLPVKLAFAPIHKRAFGTATGLAAGIALFALSIVEVLRVGSGPSPLTLINEYFVGYSVSIRGAFVGMAWGFATGFVMGWFLAFCRNLVVAVSIFWIRTRAELRATRDFLDHI